MNIQLVFLMSVVYTIISVSSIILGALVDILDKERKNSAFALSLLFSLFLGIGYGWLLGFVIFKT